MCFLLRRKKCLYDPVLLCLIQLYHKNRKAAEIAAFDNLAFGVHLTSHVYRTRRQGTSHFFGLAFHDFPAFLYEPILTARFLDRRRTIQIHFVDLSLYVIIKMLCHGLILFSTYYGDIFYHNAIIKATVFDSRLHFRDNILFDQKKNFVRAFLRTGSPFPNYST